MRKAPHDCLSSKSFYLQPWICLDFLKKDENMVILKSCYCAQSTRDHLHFLSYFAALFVLFFPSL